jgi:hypothetical protein
VFSKKQQRNKFASLEASAEARSPRQSPVLLSYHLSIFSHSRGLNHINVACNIQNMLCSCCRSSVLRHVRVAAFQMFASAYVEIPHGTRNFPGKSEFSSFQPTLRVPATGAAHQAAGCTPSRFIKHKCKSLRVLTSAKFSYYISYIVRTFIHSHIIIYG